MWPRMSLFIFLLVVQAIVATALVTVILMQRSEGGGLGMGGSPSGLMSARGAADFLTRTTKILAIVFVALAVVLAALAATQGGPAKVDTTLATQPGAAPAAAPTAPVPLDAGGGQFSGAARTATQPQGQPQGAPSGSPTAPGNQQ